MNSLPKPYYDADGITIYHGDCREILPGLGRFDLLLTDPPFGIGFAAQPTIGQRKRGQARETWDNATPEEWTLLLARKLCAKQIIWGGNYFGLPASRCWLSWYKPDAPPSMGNVEYAWTNLDQNSRQIEQSIAATNGERVGHPTQKPLRVIGWALQQAGDVQTILDPFAGSGTTGRAAKDLGRKAVLIEIEERYCEIAARRLAQQVLPLA
jgi:site-specific DNA-methyltransferase (adenine-specific)/modification methylase